MNLLSWAEIYLVSVVLITVESPYYGLMEVFLKELLFIQNISPIMIG